MGRSPQQGGIPHSYDRSGQQGWNTPEATRPQQGSFR